MNIYIFVLAIVACFTFKTFSAEEAKDSSNVAKKLNTKQLELIIQTIKTETAEEAKKVSSL